MRYSFSEIPKFEFSQRKTFQFYEFYFFNIRKKAGKLRNPPFNF